MSILLQKLLQYNGPTPAPASPRPTEKALWKRVVSRSGELIHVAIARDTFLDENRNVVSEFQDILNEFVYVFTEHEADFSFGLYPTLLLLIDASQSQRLKMLRGSDLTHRVHYLIKELLPKFLQSGVFVILPTESPASIYQIWKETLSTPRFQFISNLQMPVDSEPFLNQCNEILKSANPSWSNPLSLFTQIIDGTELREPQPPPLSYGSCPLVLDDMKTLILAIWRDPEHTELLIPTPERWRVLDKADSAYILNTGILIDRANSQSLLHLRSATPSKASLQSWHSSTQQRPEVSADLAVNNSECSRPSTGQSDSWSTLSSVQFANTLLNGYSGTPVVRRKSCASSSDPRSPSEDSVLSERVTIGNLRKPGELLQSYDELAGLSVCDWSSDDVDQLISECSSGASANINCCMRWRKNYCSAR